jgi:hypothetical protein
MKQMTLTYDSFKKVMTLITYLGESSSSMIRMLNESPDLSEVYFQQLNYYKGILVGIRNRAQKAKTAWINAAADQNAFFEKIHSINLMYENLQKDFRDLYEITEHIFEVNYFIDTEGTLIKKIKAKVRNEN